MYNFNRKFRSRSQNLTKKKLKVDLIKDSNFTPNNLHCNLYVIRFSSPSQELAFKIHVSP